MLMIGKLGQYKSELPDFMVFLGHTFLPTFWKPFYSLGFSLAMVLLLPGLVALIFGYLAFRSVSVRNLTAYRSARGESKVEGWKQSQQS